MHENEQFEIHLEKAGIAAAQRRRDLEEFNEHEITVELGFDMKKREQEVQEKLNRDNMKV